MSAEAVPEDRDLRGDDAARTIERATGAGLFKASIRRFRTADGTTHTRAVGHAAALTIFPVLIALTGAGSFFGLTTLRQIMERTLETLAPAASGQVLATTFRQVSNQGGTALVVGGVSALFTGTLAMAIVERGCSRIYGVDHDRPGVRRYLVAFALNLSAGTMLLVALALLAAGAALGDALRTALGWSDSWSTGFAIARWPAGFVLVFAAMTLIYKMAPNRPQPKASWLFSGTLLGTILWVAFSALLAVYYAFAQGVRSAYGPLVGVVALLTWTYATALAVFLGMAFAAELEAVRSGAATRPDTSS